MERGRQEAIRERTRSRIRGWVAEFQRNSPKNREGIDDLFTSNAKAAQDFWQNGTAKETPRQKVEVIDQGLGKIKIVEGPFGESDEGKILTGVKLRGKGESLAIGDVIRAKVGRNRIELKLEGRISTPGQNPELVFVDALNRAHLIPQDAVKNKKGLYRNYILERPEPNKDAQKVGSKNPFNRGVVISGLEVGDTVVGTTERGIRSTLLVAAFDSNTGQLIVEKPGGGRIRVGGRGGYAKAGSYWITGFDSNHAITPVAQRIKVFEEQAK